MREGLCSSNRGEDMGKEQGGMSSRTEQEVLCTAWPIHTCQCNCGTGHCYAHPSICGCLHVHLVSCDCGPNFNSGSSSTLV
jgi:hypothetical protein